MGRKIIGGGAGRRGDKDAIAVELGEPLLAVNQNAQFGDICGVSRKSETSFIASASWRATA